jgi:transposase
MRVSGCNRSCEEEQAPRVRLRGAMVVLAWAGGNTVPAIARLVQGDEDAIRGVIHRFNETGMASLDPQWAGGRPRLISPEDQGSVTGCSPSTSSVH